MKLENQVANRELSQRLQELGVKQESYFYWINQVTEEWKGRKIVLQPSDSWLVKIGTSIGVSVSAFTVAELGEMLPNGWESFKANTAHIWNRERQTWGCGWSSPDAVRDHMRKTKHPTIFFADTEANARAKMLIYLIEQKLITL